MFKDATLGLAATPFGIARRCVECRAAGHEGDEQACTGFGPGCLVTPKASGPAADEDRDFRFEL